MKLRMTGMWNRNTICNILLFLLLIISADAFSGSAGPVAEAYRTDDIPVIDGVLDEECWVNAFLVKDFRQYDPDHGEKAKFDTEVRILYDDQAIYIAAKMFDPSPDSILRQLGDRDQGGLNADLFGIKFDTYNNQRDAYAFEVTASGVQKDYRLADWTYSSVWDSEVMIHNSGWNVEMRIPLSSIRFPSTEVQEWGLQVYRLVRRYRSWSQWALEDKEANNKLEYWGKLSDIKNIEPPLNISLTPYLSIAGEHYPQENYSNNYSGSFSGGIDLKVGLNESFTLDMTLLPDFSQVKSDDPVKNLSAFETVYAEQRPFFRESMDLFRKGGLFYSRRIGRTPSEFYTVDDDLDSTQRVIINPSQAELVNAFKVSGRNANGTAVGVLNAFTKNTFAEIENEDGSKSSILTEPAANYNVTVVDQTLKNNSSLYIVNTNLVRTGKKNNANVTAAGVSLKDKSNTWQINGSSALSQRFIYQSDTSKNRYTSDLGARYNLSFNKIKGKVKFGVWSAIIDGNYNINDMGQISRNNYENYGTSISYNQYEPLWIFKNFNTWLNLNTRLQHETKKNENLVMQYGINMTLNNYLYLWYRFNVSPLERYDYYDPRTDGYYIIRPGYLNTSVGFSSDYRKPVAFDGHYSANFDEWNYQNQTIVFRPIIRVSNRFSFHYRIRYQQATNSKGYIDNIDNTVYYGNRDLSTFENSFSSKYLFSNNLSLSIWMRQYWYQGEYNEFYVLEDNGTIEEQNDFDGNYDFNFNAVNIDLSVNWEFAPGSKLNLVWKNSLVEDSDEIAKNILDNIENLSDTPQRNTLSIKLLYYIDYQTVKTQVEKFSERNST
jgi:hypothetical protein